MRFGTIVSALSFREDQSSFLGLSDDIMKLEKGIGMSDLELDPIPDIGYN